MSSGNNTDRKIDMVAMSILDSTMVSVCREMGITLMKTSYSTIFNEALDFTCAIAAPNGDMYAAIRSGVSPRSRRTSASSPINIRIASPRRSDGTD